MKIVSEIPLKILFLVITILFIYYYTFISHPSLGIGTGSGGTNFNILSGMQLDFSKGAIINTVGNIVLFVPLGIALSVWSKDKNNALKIVFIGASLSVLIEMIQFLMPNRWTDINDVLLNSFGTGIGYLIFLFGSLLFAKKNKHQIYEIETQKEV